MGLATNTNLSLNCVLSEIFHPHNPRVECLHPYLAELFNGISILWGRLFVSTFSILSKLRLNHEGNSEYARAQAESIFTPSIISDKIQSQKFDRHIELGLALIHVLKKKEVILAENTPKYSGGPCPLEVSQDLARGLLICRDLHE